MALTPPKRLFRVPSMSTVMYVDVADDIKEKGYVAISHVWGEQKMYSADELGINGGVDWKIPLSDSKKIRRLVDAMNYYGMEYCWFDVLCMPQDKQNEINLEIPFMGDYYDGAHMTFVLSDESYVISEDYIRWCDMMSDMMESRRSPKLDEHSWMLKERADLLDLYKDKWFTRVWTLQEAVLSRKVILISINGHHINLTSLINKLAYLSVTNDLYGPMTFEKSNKPILGMAAATLKHRNGSLDLLGILNINKGRDCYKIHDKFYGVLGILGYKDFPVDYDMDIDGLNKAIARYSHSKGDVSWICVGENVGSGFIQPMYKDFSSVGSGWKENTLGICGIIFGDTLSMKAMDFATVVSCKKFTRNSGTGDMISWVIRGFREWGFSTLEILGVMLQYTDVPKNIAQVATVVFDAICKGKNLEDTVSEMDGTFAEDRGFMPLIDVFQKALSTDGLHKTMTIIDAKMSIINQRYPLVVIGDVDVGDKIMVPQMHDFKKRNIGIVTYHFKRKGVCLVPRIKMDDNLKPIYFVHREFML